MSAWLIITADSIQSETSPAASLKVDRQYLIEWLKRSWPEIEITAENDESATVHWWLSLVEGDVVKAWFDGDISFIHNADSIGIDARSSVPYVTKFMHWYRGIVPETYQLSVGNDWGGPEDQFDLTIDMSEADIHHKIREWVND